MLNMKLDFEDDDGGNEDNLDGFVADMGKRMKLAGIISPWEEVGIRGDFMKELGVGEDKNSTSKKKQAREKYNKLLTQVGEGQPLRESSLESDTSPSKIPMYT